MDSTCSFSEGQSIASFDLSCVESQQVTTFSCQVSKNLPPCSSTSYEWRSSVGRIVTLHDFPSNDNPISVCDFARVDDEDTGLPQFTRVHLHHLHYERCCSVGLYHGRPQLLPVLVHLRALSPTPDVPPARPLPVQQAVLLPDDALCQQRRQSGPAHSERLGPGSASGLRSVAVPRPEPRARFARSKPRAARAVQLCAIHSHISNPFAYLRSIRKSPIHPHISDPSA